MNTFQSLTIFGLLLGAALWFLSYGMYCSFNNRTILSCLSEEIRWLLPGGLALKTAYIKRMVNRFEEGWVGDWQYSQIRDNDLYEEVAKQVLPGPVSFFVNHLLIPLTPLAIVYAIYFGFKFLTPA